MSYPSITDLDLQEKIANKKEFQIQSSNQTIEDICTPQRFKLLPHQQFVRNFLAPHTPYNNLLLFFGIGSGKTCSAIQIAEEHKNQKRKIIVLLEEGVRNNFINEIHNIDKGQNQCTGLTYQKYKKTHTRDEKEKIKQNQIKQFYKFKTLGKFTNEILKTNSQKIKQNYSNRLIIIDEVHNFREYDTDQPKRYDALKKMLSKAENCKLLLLSATPMFDNPREIVSLTNLFLINERKTTLNPDHLFNSKDQLTSNGVKLLKQSLNGQVSFVGQTSKAFPQAEFKGTLFPFMEQLKLVECQMSPFQEAQYKSQVNQHITTLRKNSNIIQPESREDLKQIGKISCKFERLLKEISKTRGPVFIYSEFVEHTIKLLKQTLLAHGYKQYVNDHSTNSFIVLEGTATDSKKRTKLINIANQPENKNGKIIKIIIGSKVLKEGISLKNIRQVHILEPWYNMSRLEQVWGRAIRACSHVLLPPEKQKVKIYLYAATFKELPNNITELIKKDFAEMKTKIPYDLYAYYLSEQKGLKIKKVENVLKQIAVNVGKKTTTEATTFEELYVIQPNIVLTKNIIRDVLKQKGMISLKQLLRNRDIQKNHITESIINAAVYELEQEKPKVMIRRDNYLIIQPPNKDEKISMFDRKNTFIRRRYPLVLEVEPRDSSSSQQRKEKKFQAKPTIVKNDKTIGDYQGILMSDGSFLIKQIIQETTNKRKQTRGKNCMSWKTDELKQIAQTVLTEEELKQFFVDKRIKNKAKFCKLLTKKFYP